MHEKLVNGRMKNGHVEIMRENFELEIRWIQSHEEARGQLMKCDEVGCEIMSD